MKRLVWLALGWMLFAGALRATGPVPYTEGVSFSYKASGSGATWMTIYDETGNATVDLTPTGTPAESAMGTAWLRPGVLYTGFYYADGNTSYSLSFIVPAGYRLLVDERETNLVSSTTVTAGADNNYFSLRLLPKSDITTPMPFGSFSGIKVGQSISWSIGLGGMQLDRNAGWISFKEYDLNTGPASRDPLFLVTTQYNTADVWPEYDSGTQRLKVVHTVSGKVTIDDDPSLGGYVFSFYSVTGNTTTAWKTIRVQQPSSSQLKITETEGGVTRVSQLTLVSGPVSGGYYQWRLQEGNATTWLRTTTHISTLVSGGREETVEVRTGDTSGALVARTKYRYENVGGWGEELTQVVADPNGAALTTNYTYYTDSGSRGDYRRIRSVSRAPAGGWTAYDYYDDWDRRGQLKYQAEPDQDTPASVPSTIDTSSGHVAYYEYVADWTGRFTRPNMRQEWRSGLRVGQTTYGVGDNYPANDFPHEYAFTMAYSDGTNYRQDYAEAWRADAYPSVADRPYGSWTADGSMTVWSMGSGDYNATTGAFTAGTSIAYGRRIVVHGSKTNSSGANSVSSWDGHTFASLYLIPGKATMDVTIYQGGQVLRTEQRVYTGSDFVLLGWVQNTYSDQGRVTEQKLSNGTKTTYTYTGGLLTQVVGFDGVTVDYTYDGLGRVKTMTKAGVAATGIHQAQAALTTTYNYDGADHVASTVLSGAGETETIASSQVVDLAGRVTRVTPPNPAGTGSSAITYSYNPTYRTVTMTTPDGATTIQEAYRDGRLKSVTGTATVPTYYTYFVESDGRQRTQVNSGSLGSARLVKSWTDWMGRVIKSEKPGFSKSGQLSYIEEQIYNPTTGQLAKTNRTGYAPICYTYNTLGQLVSSGLDVDTTPNGLSASSMDRLNVTDTVIEESPSASGTWWLKITTTTYPDDNADTHKIESTSRQRLTGLSTSLLSETQVTDAEGNTVVTKTSVSVSDKLVTTRTSVPGITAADAYTYSYNGLASATTGHDGLTSKLTYDKLGRPWISTDVRGNTTTTTYVSGTALTATVKDGTAATVSTVGYDPMGRTSWTADALSQMTHFVYNLRGQVTRQWGTATYPVAYSYDATLGDRTGLSTYRDAPADDNWPAGATADTTTWIYDEASGLLWQKVDAATKAVVMDYNRRGQLFRRTLARGVYTDYTYSDVTGELLSENYSDATPDITYAYTRLGQPKTVTEGAGTTNQWIFTYDTTKPWRLANTKLPAYYGTRYQTPIYETSGALGRYLGFKLGSSAGGAQDLEQTYAYSPDGRFDTLTSIRANNSGTSRTFDYSYKAHTPFVAGYTASGVSNYSVALDYEDNRDLLKTIDTQWAGASLVRYDYTYDARYQRKTAKLSGDAYSDYWAGTSYKSVCNYYDYNARGELQTAAMYKGNATAGPITSAAVPADELPGRRFEYRFDAIGNRKSSGPTGSPAGVDDLYITNALNQYTSKENNTVRFLGTVGVQSNGAQSNVAVKGAIATSRNDRAWGADLVPANEGGALSASADVYAAVPGTGGTADKAGKQTISYFTPAAVQEFGYDDDGNLTRDAVWDYTYDGENRLVGMQQRSEAIGTGKILQANARKLTFAYDYVGRRVRKTVYSWNSTDGAYTTIVTDTKFLYDGSNLIAEFKWNSSTSTFDLTRSYTWGLDLTGSLDGAGGVGALLQVYDAGVSKTLLPAYDGNGNVMAMVNAASGALEAIYEYDPYGNVLRKEGGYAGENPIRFSSKYADKETDLLYYGFRYYSANLGRFINRDPIEESGGLNLYGFVGNDAVNGWDLLGWADGNLTTGGGNYPPGTFDVPGTNTGGPSDPLGGGSLGGGGYGGGPHGSLTTVGPNGKYGIWSDGSLQVGKTIVGTIIKVTPTGVYIYKDANGNEMIYNPKSNSISSNGTPPKPVDPSTTGTGTTPTDTTETNTTPTDTTTTTVTTTTTKIDEAVNLPRSYGGTPPLASAATTYGEITAVTGWRSRTSAFQQGFIDEGMASAWDLSKTMLLPPAAKAFVDATGFGFHHVDTNLLHQGYDSLNDYQKGARVFGLAEYLTTIFAGPSGVAESAASPRATIVKGIEEYLGPGSRAIKNEAGDLILVSKDGTKRVRFDINKPYPHESPHSHVEELVNGKWEKSGQIYPIDVPHR